MYDLFPNEFAGISGSGAVFRDMLKTTTAKSLFVYNDEFYNHLSAITVNDFEEGQAYYIGTGVDNGTMDALAAKIIADAAIESIDTEEGVEAVKREVDGETYYFVMNHTDKVKSFNDIELKAYESKIIKN